MPTASDSEPMTRTTVFHLPASLWRRVCIAAAEQGLYKGAIAALAIREYLERYETAKAAKQAAK